MRLYIAEKPSVARELAAVLGIKGKGGGYIDTNGGVVTWLFGHVLRQAEPDEYDERYKRWNEADLPITPKNWRLFVSETAAQQFNTVKNLIERADEIVHAGDPDREGQLLVDEVLDFVGCKKTVKRILLNALDEESIHDALSNLRDNKEFKPLMLSALARARADWLVGMNLSRAYTLAARRAGYENLVLPIGRVKTPTLALAVRREREIENFKPTEHYAIKAKFSKDGESFFAIWKPKEDLEGVDSEGRLLNKKIAEEKLSDFLKEPKNGKIATFEKKKQSEKPPLPFSLSSLQVLAGKRFGYAPQLVLDTAQSLYEKKLTSYPRSDSEYVPENQYKDRERIIGNLRAIGGVLEEWTNGANLKLKSRAFNDKKVSAHHAIIPTKIKANLRGLTEVERNLYILIARNYIAQFYPDHVFEQAKLTVAYKEEIFAATGRTEVETGWKVLYKEAKKDDEEERQDENGKLPPMRKGSAVQFEDGKVEIKTTKPPSRFTPATLLAAMKGIHKYVLDPALKAGLKAVYGIGTEATRASMIDELLKRGFLKYKGKTKQLIPTDAAYLMIDILPKDMTYPDKTAVWEDYLREMADGKGTLESFINEQIDFVKELVEAAKKLRIKPVGKYPCPRCNRGSLVKRNGKNGVFWGCSNYPNCRMTAEDKNGAPDLAGKGASREQYQYQSFPSSYSSNTVPDDVIAFLNSEGAGE
ncbi:MAG: DNA topoisomerase 3 [Selenomonadaceae bacterium]|nr:DNA topoisomerase 3 [Selenomonadaceae bacterium]